MNRWGRLFSVSIFGASHGEVVGVMIEGCPPGLALENSSFYADLERRKGCETKGTTPRKEGDIPHIIAGVFNGFTTGAPIVITFENKNIRPEDYEKLRAIPRPSHADWVAHEKFFGYEDYRGGGAFSARLTVALVAAGVIAKKLLKGVSIQSQVTAIGGIADIEAGLNKAIQAKDSIGGIIETQITGVPAGWGEPFFESLESSLAQMMFAIPAVRGIEFGAGFAAANMMGLEHNDAITNEAGTTQTNHAGGIVGGISNGNPIVFRIAVKPAASTPQPQESWNWETQQMEQFSIKGRHDLCVALRAPVIVEAAAAIVLLDHCWIQENRKNAHQKLSS